MKGEYWNCFAGMGDAGMEYVEMDCVRITGAEISHTDIRRDITDDVKIIYYNSRRFHEI
jgi:hypothetical protein